MIFDDQFLKLSRASWWGGGAPNPYGHRWARGDHPPTAGGAAKSRQGGPGGQGIGGPRRKIGRIGGPTVGRGPRVR